jgi:hypothetical protein
MLSARAQVKNVESMDDIVFRSWLVGAIGLIASSLMASFLMASSLIASSLPNSQAEISSCSEEEEEGGEVNGGVAGRGEDGPADGERGRC